MGRRDVANRPFGDELPRILGERGITLRALTREVGGLDHAYLSRMLRGRVPVNVQHARRIARYLRLPEDYFAEVREAAVVDAIRRRPKLRDDIYFERIKRRAG
jgi:transcriptional regulator with XRE-family HTH domain